MQKLKGYRNSNCKAKMWRAGSKRKIQEKHRQTMVIMVRDKPQTTSIQLLEHLASDCVVDHGFNGIIRKVIFLDKLEAF